MSGENSAATPSRSVMSEMIVNCVSYSDGKSMGSVDLEDISEILRFEGQFVWIGLHEPDEELLRKIQEEFGLHDLAVEDAQRAHQRPKLEEYGDSLFVVLRTAQTPGSCEVAFGETHLFVGARYVVTVRHGASLSYADVRAALRERRRTSCGRGPDSSSTRSWTSSSTTTSRSSTSSRRSSRSSRRSDLRRRGSRRDNPERIYELKRELLAAQARVSPLIDVCNRSCASIAR